MAKRNPGAVSQNPGQDIGQDIGQGIGQSIGDDYPFQRRQWRAERWGWGLGLLVLLAALLGLTGHGPLSGVTLRPGGAEVRSERFAREGRRYTLGVEAQGGDELRVGLHRDFLGTTALQRVTPDPSETELEGEWVTLVFKTSGAVRLDFEMEPQSMGLTWVRVRVGESEAAHWQWVYP